ncbi:filamentous haemagglutinin family protein [Nibricoccus sp. IMCC34717]|uniref:filamentous haemagglutinin family protein n=1 Tax=Nibricoccus sp. IMCC34717 TaxID=3034021 RepID=UPI00384E5D76
MAIPLLVHAADIARPARQASVPSSAAGPAPGNTVGVPLPARPDAEARIQAARDAVARARNLQDAAATLAKQALAAQKAGANLWRIPLPGETGTVEVAGGLRRGGLVPKIGGTWTGADMAVEKVTDAGFDVSIKQNSQQAVLEWASFNIAPNTTLLFDQSAAGENVQNWIAFNKVTVTGTPSLIFGAINAPGQVYVVNPNGIIFGGSAQINTHTLVASSLPINDRLIERGLLNNPDNQFLFSAFSQSSGQKGPTAAFVPKVTDVVKFPEVVSASEKVVTLAKTMAASDLISVAVNGGDANLNSLTLGTDFTSAVDAESGRTAVAFTSAGLEKISGKTVEFNYTAAPSSLGDVVVQAGAKLYAPAQGNTGGRIALVGRNVSNQGHISTPNGQAILAAGLEVGFVPHAQSDPSLRGLDVYVGRVAETSTPGSPEFGQVSNDVFQTASGDVGSGIVETRDLTRTEKQADGTVVAAPLDVPGSVLFAGRSIRQDGIVNLATTVAFNGRADFLANYNAKANDSTAPDANPIPFYFRYDPTVEGGGNTGVVSFGKRSVTQIIPSASTKDTIASSVDKGLTLRSQLNVVGRGLHLESDVPVNATQVAADRSAAKIIAPNATVRFDAGAWNLVDPTTAVYRNQFVYSNGQIFLDRGTSIDASGTRGAQAPMSRNLVDVQLRGSELADAPLQRDGVLRGKTVKVDARVHGDWDSTLNNGAGGYAWIGTPLADTSGWLALVERTAGELTVNGGDVSLNAGKSVVAMPLSVVDVSGGWIEYAGGSVSTTKVVSGGNIFDISQATKDRIYSGIFDGTNISESEKWGVTETSRQQALIKRSESGYFEGGGGGRLSFSSPTMALDGSLRGNVASGVYQTAITPTAGRQQFVARPSSLKIQFGADTVSTEAKSLRYSPYTPNVTFGSGSTLAAVSKNLRFDEVFIDEYLNEERRDEVAIDPLLFNSGEFGFLSLDVSDDDFGGSGVGRQEGLTYGRVTFNAADPIHLTAASAIGRATGTPGLSILAANITVNGSITAPGSTIDLRARNVSQSRNTELLITTSREGRGSISFGPKASLNVSGRVEDFRVLDRTENETVATVAGSILATGYNISAASGSRFEASGGAEVSATRRVTWGDAGRIALIAANEREFDGATLSLSQSLRGFADPKDSVGGFFAYSGSTRGGTLALQGPYFAIEPGSDLLDSQRTTRLSSNIFGLGGFSSFEFTGLVDRSAPNRAAFTVSGVAKTQKSAAIPLTLQPSTIRYTTDLQAVGAGAIKKWNLPAGAAFDPLRSPISISLSAKGDRVASDQFPLGVIGRIEVSDTATLSLSPNPRSKVSISGDEIAVLGTLAAPGAQIELNAAASRSVDVASPTLYLGPKSRVLAPGAIFTATNPLGYETGTVLDGGRVSIRGNVVTAIGAIVDVSGAKGTVWVPEAQVSPLVERPFTQLDSYVKKEIESNGGSISLIGVQELFSDATLLAKSGGGSALGGSLSVSSGTFLRQEEVADVSAPNLVVVANGAVGPTDLGTTGSPLGQVLVRRETEIVEGEAQTKEVVLSPVLRADGQPSFGGTISAATINAGGFDFIDLKGRVSYSGAVSVSAGSAIRLADGGILKSDTVAPSSLSVSAPYVQLGMPFLMPGEIFTPSSTYSATYGTGTVSVKAGKWLDLGTLTFRDSKAVSLEVASGGDLRGVGTISVAGKLSLIAGQIYAPTASTLTFAAFNPTKSDGTPVLDAKAKTLSGSVEIGSSGDPKLVPLSAGSNLQVFADTILQNGVVRAPLGQIKLGVSESAPLDSLSGKAFPNSSKVVLGETSYTSVSTTDLKSGKPLALPIPYGLSPEGTTWIDPTGSDITVADSSGRTAKRVTIGGTSVEAREGSKVDIEGGGDLFAYRWVLGVGGKNDILSSSGPSFAILPDYNPTLAPFAPFNPDTTGTGLKLGGDLGYFSSNLTEGDSLYLDLDPTDSVGAKAYTLLPARYALLPGAYLVTLRTATSVGNVTQPDGALLTSAYRYNSLNSTRATAPLYASWEVAPAALVHSPTTTDVNGNVVKARAQYQEFSGVPFFTEAAAANNVDPRRLAWDAGQLAFVGMQNLTLSGAVSAKPYIETIKKTDGSTETKIKGRGGWVDISTNSNIEIVANPESAPKKNNTLYLDSGELSSYGAESLLVGGLRKEDSQGAYIEVATSQLRLANAAEGGGADTLTGADVILVARDKVTAAAGSALEQKGVLTGNADTYRLTSTRTLSNGQKLTVYRGGGSLEFPNGMTGGTLVPTVAYRITAADGSTSSFAPGKQITTLASGSRVTLETAGTITYTSTAIGATVAIAASDGALLRATDSSGATVVRDELAYLDAANISVEQGARLSARNLKLDSSYALSVSGNANLEGFSSGTDSVLSLSSGKVALVADSDGKDSTNRLEVFGLTKEEAAQWLILGQAEIQRLIGLSAARGFKGIDLNSYTSIYLGSDSKLVFGSDSLGSLSLHAGEIRGFGKGSTDFIAKRMTLDNRSDARALTYAGSAVAGDNATLSFISAESLRLGSGKLAVLGFEQTKLNAAKGIILGDGEAGSNRKSGEFGVEQGLRFDVPSVVAESGAGYQLRAGGDVVLGKTSGTPDSQGGLGASLSILGKSVDLDTAITLASGKLEITTTNGDLSVSGVVDASGRAQAIHDAQVFSDGGSISLNANGGSIRLEKDGRLDVSAPVASSNTGRVVRNGDAGLLSLRATGVGAEKGRIYAEGSLLGLGGVALNGGEGVGSQGRFRIDASVLDNLADLNSRLDAGGFYDERLFRARTGDLTVGSSITAHRIELVADKGNVVINSRLDASGTLGGLFNTAGLAYDSAGNTGGRIAIFAAKSVTLGKDANLTVAAGRYNAAGKGGSVLLSAGAPIDGITATTTQKRDEVGRFNAETVATVTVEKGAIVDLGVAASKVAVAKGTEVGVRAGDLIQASKDGLIIYSTDSVLKTLAYKSGEVVRIEKDGKLALFESGEMTRLVDTAIGAATGTLHLRAPRTTPATGASDVQVNPVNGLISGASSIVVEGAATYLVDETKKETIDSLKTKVAAEAASFGSSSSLNILRNTLAGSNSSLLASLHVRPGVEIISRGADLMLNSTWDFASLRYGAAADSKVPGSGEPGYLRLRTAKNLVLKSGASLSDGFLAQTKERGGLWRGTLLAPNTDSWSFELVAGADLQSANPESVLPIEALSLGSGSFIAGPDAKALTQQSLAGLKRATIVPNYFQVVRTGTGDIRISAARDVNFIAPLFSVYTAGTALSDPSRVLVSGDFDIPSLYYNATGMADQLFGVANDKLPYPAQFSQRGGDLEIRAGRDLFRSKPDGSLDSAKQMPTNWLYRRGNVAEDGSFRKIQTQSGAITTAPESASTAWWISFDNFFQDVGALAGGNVSFSAGGNIRNVSASVATNARVSSNRIQGDGTITRLAANQALSEFGGGDLSVVAAGNIDGGAYYVERGRGTVRAGGDITTNSARTTVSESQLASAKGTLPDRVTWLPTTFFLGKGGFDVAASGTARIGSVTNPFLLAQDINNSPYQATFFTTASDSNSVRIRSLQGDVTLVGETGRQGDLNSWYANVLNSTVSRFSAAGLSQPWLLLLGAGTQRYESALSTGTALFPSNVSVSALSGSINLASNLTLLPSSQGNLDLVARDRINGFMPLATQVTTRPHDPATNPYSFYGYSVVTVSDADFSSFPSIFVPEGWSTPLDTTGTFAYSPLLLTETNRKLAENERVNGPLQDQQALHGRNPNANLGDSSQALHANDSRPIRIYAGSGDVTGVALFSPKATRVVAGRDLTDVRLTLQNARSEDSSVLFAGRDVIFFNPNSLTRRAAPDEVQKVLLPLSGNVQIGGPGSLQILAGRNIDLGPAQGSLGSSSGVASVGNGRNPYLPFSGASLVLGAGLTDGVDTSLAGINFKHFVDRYLNPATAPKLSKRYLPVLAQALAVSSSEEAWEKFSGLMRAGEGAVSNLFSEADLLTFTAFFRVLRDAGRDYNNPDSLNFGTYKEGELAIGALFPKPAAGKDEAWPHSGSISLASRSVRTTNGGGITVLAPGGGVSLGRTLSASAVGSPPGIVTEYGGGISIFTRNDVDVGISRIFTLRGGDEVIWSSLGSIAAGISSKTVQAAPPTRVLIDAQSANVKTDLAGLATGGGIGVLASVAGVKPGDVDLIAPKGTVDAGDAGIRSSGNLNIAALQILNAANIQAGGAATGTPPAPPAPNLTIAAASNAASVSSAETKESSQAAASEKPVEVAKLPSLIQVDVLGYGGGDDEEEQEGSDEAAAAPSNAESDGKAATRNSADVAP